MEDHKKEENHLFIGIDLNNTWAMVSLFCEGMEEAETVSTVPGEERYQIPVAVFCTNQGNYYYGDEAVKRQDRADGTYFSDLYAESMDPEHMAHRNMLVMFIRRLLKFKERYDNFSPVPYLAVTVPQISSEVVNLFDFLRQELGFATEKFQLMDDRESFFGFAFHQDPSVRRHDIALFDLEDGRVSFTLLHDDGQDEVSRVTSISKEWEFPEEQLADDVERDEFFAGIVREACAKKIISAVYLIGVGFGGNWMRETLRVIGPNKRVFLGQNIYTMGACYVGYRNIVTWGWNYYYDSLYKLQGELSIKVTEDGTPHFLPLVHLGENWFSPTEKFFVLYDGNPDFEVRVRSRKQTGERIESFSLDFPPDRAPRSIRLGVQAVPKNGREVLLRIWDDGFGELFESSGKVWEFTMELIK